MAQYGLIRPSAGDSWTPIDQLRREMDALWSRFGGSVTAPGPGQGVFPAVNLYENADAYVLTAELPGVDAKDIDVSIQGATVILSGERRPAYTPEQDVSVHRRERPVGRFRRAFQLPTEVAADEIEAAHRNGVLLLRMPKTPEQQPRQIKVQAG